MGRNRKPPQPMKPAPGLQLVPAPARPSMANFGMSESAGDELRDLIRSINARGKKKEKPAGDDELPPAA